MARNNRIIALFDVDGTITEPRAEATEKVKAFLQLLRSKVVVGIVGGSDLVKQQEQVGANVVNEVILHNVHTPVSYYHSQKIPGTVMLQCSIPSNINLPS